jgi:exodeoxyribonuclease VII large subunit
MNLIDNLYSEIFKNLKKININEIEAEIISIKISDSNAWINLKVESYQITGVFWKIIYENDYENISKIRPGDKVKIKGNFSIMKKNLNIYLNIKSMNKTGLGEYLTLHNENRKRIYNQGMHLNKKELSLYPQNIGIITSLEGAAIQDILQTFKNDNLYGNVIIKNSIVQGQQCPSSLIKSIEYFKDNYNNKLDVLLITRGGGSFEDLVGFSDWNLIEKIHKIKFLTISAVGHQIDNQLSDDICDYKFATPSISAKFLIEKQQYYLDIYENLKTLIINKKKDIKKSKKNFKKVKKDYKNIINNYEIDYIKTNINEYSRKVKNILKNYLNAKDNFYNKLDLIKPKIYKKDKQLYSINDFISLKTLKAKKDNNIKLQFYNGEIEISYKIINYDIYNN